MPIFGPVPSRRLGKSLGINNVPLKKCTYACVYCQLGNALGLTWDRGTYYAPALLAGQVKKKLEGLSSQGEEPDFLTIVPDGEPTLDLNLGPLIQELRPLGIKIAVISNGSTLQDPLVRQALARADWVSVKVDAVEEEPWKRINRPHGRAKLADIQSGIERFREEFEGTLATETMLVRDLNDRQQDLQGVGGFLARIQPAVSYLAIPTRPPAEGWVLPPTEESLNRAYQIFRDLGLETELLTGFEGTDFSSTGDIEADLLSITAVHPLREDAVKGLLDRCGEDLSTLRRLIQEGKIALTSYQGKRYYLRKFSKDR